MKPKKSYLTIDDLIEKLNSIREERGNLPIRIGLPGLPMLPTISAVRCDGASTSASSGKGIVGEKAVIDPNYDPKGTMVECMSATYLGKQFWLVQTQYSHVFELLRSIKKILESSSKAGKGIPLAVKKSFIQVIKETIDIKKILEEVQGFDKRMYSLINEPIADYDYPLSYDQHIDPSMTDEGFAKELTKAIEDKTDIQRMAILVEVIKKVEEEIENRRTKREKLGLRGEDDCNSPEVRTAQFLKKKTEHYIETLQKRKRIVAEKVDDLRRKIEDQMNDMVKEVQKFIAD